ncbi:hypothetical protein D9613_006229 [Agrocybe pediades]|uniref:MYND-type domain-containing protein n=1 Tax=Agrocybe pediades TaxID=84607 RepID=A0A8H4QWI5_9AGAR|nr:hypothetical protein D9613_006229 [Agrocybe pediades]
MTTVGSRKIHLPLLKIEKCGAAACNKTSTDGKLMVCSGCAEIAYCSSACQKADWSNHKGYCGKTDRIDLEQYYPFIACLSVVDHYHPAVPPHPALRHEIVNNPCPGGGDIVNLPDGTAVKLILLGDEISLQDMTSKAWWPSAPSDKVRTKMVQRIMGEGLLLPSLLSTVFALVSEMYTTTAISRDDSSPSFQSSVLGTRQRVRLMYENSPIADIGIVQGSVRVVAQDRLAYYNILSDEFLMGGNPEEHYWIYFKTLAGNEYFLDCGMYTYNCCIVVGADPYTKYGFPPTTPLAPAFFYNREMRKAMPGLNMVGWKPRKRFSILRETRLFDIMERPDINDITPLHAIMDEIAGRTCSSWEKEMLGRFVPDARMRVRLNMKHREYRNFPKEVQMGIDNDPDETIHDGSTEEDKAFEKYLRKWARRLKRGEISPERWVKAFGAWRDRPHEARMKMVQSGNERRRAQQQ